MAAAASPPPPPPPPPRARPHRYRPWTFTTLSGVASLVLPIIALVRLYFISRLSVYTLVYGCAISGVTFLMYGYDKMQARNLEWRVKETTLQTLALVGGWPGALAGMHYFQHKTRKTRFQVVFWGIVLGWEGVACMVCSGGVRVW
ncbi:hypothetical protein ACJBU6_01996 [Exserohilum turcicum]